MFSHSNPTRHDQSRLSFALTVIFLLVLWVSGGASRADVIGQVITRSAAWAILIALILFAPRPMLRPVAPVAFFVFASITLVVLQLVPLPPAVWTALPGRNILEQASIVTGQDQPWRPLSFSPGATINALSSLIVAVLALLLAASLRWSEHWRIAGLLLCLILASCLLGLLQFSGGRFDHPLINDVSGSVSASFANRNHFALFAAYGCILAPAWAFRGGDSRTWRAPVALTLVPLFALIILATGSRTGMLVGAIGIVLGLAGVWRNIQAELRRMSKRTSIGLLVISIIVLATALILSVTLGRAVSLDRILDLELGEDLRRQALPTVVAMTQLYFPFGSGVGAFDPVYRIHEPIELLNRAYFNHAHNDWLEIVLDAGLAGLLLLVTAVVWWGWRSVRVWRSANPMYSLSRVGSGLLLLTFIASITDYPARTPMIMATVVISAVWLHGLNTRDASIDASRPSKRKLAG